MSNVPVPEESEINGLVGHKFAGGEYTIEHWENFLLTECTGAAPLPDHLAHPVALFHVPILGANTSIQEMFDLGQAQADNSIHIESYDWEFFSPLREQVRYTVNGEITEADRRSEGDQTFDRIQFRFDLAAPDGTLTARTTITWQYGRSQ